LLAVLLLFTTAATKLPSYWLPATPAAALLICFALGRRDRWLALAWASSLALVLLLAVGFWCAPLWVPLIKDPEMPTLASDLLASGLVWRAAGWFSLAALLGFVVRRGSPVVRLLSVQLSLVCFHLTAVIPIAELADRLRQLPVRQATQTLVDQQRPQEPLAMVGAMKPSVHFYAGQVILFEGRSNGALVNLADRLSKEQRRGWRGVPLTSPDASPTVLLIIDEGTLRQKHWRGLQPEKLGRFGVYTVWRVERTRLNDRAAELMADGVDADWQKPRPERF
jgi:hypothetical protein